MSALRLLCWRDGQTQEKRGALAHFALKPYLAAVLLHDQRVCQGQSLTRSFADILGSKERLEDAPTNSFRNPGTRVLDSNLRPIAFPLRLYCYGALSFRAVPHHVVDGM